MVGSQRVEHVVDDLLDGVRDGRQGGQFQRSGLHQLHSIRTFDSQVLKLVVRGWRKRKRWELVMRKEVLLNSIPVIISRISTISVGFVCFKKKRHGLIKKSKRVKDVNL